MKKMRKIGLLALMAGLAIACSKDNSRISSNGVYQDEYRFYATAKINGLPVEYNAGEDGYGLETDYTIEDSVVVMTGKLARENASLQSAIVLRIRGNEQVGNENDFIVGEALRPGLYAFRDNSGRSVIPGSYELQFLGDTNFSPLQYYWTFDDGSVSSSAAPPAINVAVDDYDPFMVTLKTNYYGCESTVTHWVNIEKDCDATIEISNVTSYDFSVSATSRKGNILSVDWLLDGYEVEPSFSGKISAYLTGEHTLKAEIHFEEGCSKVVERTFDASSSTPCITDFWCEKKKATTIDHNQLGAVELEFYDENGKKFTSYYSGTDGDFKIVSLSPYRENEKGQKTTRFFFEANAILKNEDGTSVELTECFGSFAVSHP